MSATAEPKTASRELERTRPENTSDRPFFENLHDDDVGLPDRPFVRTPGAARTDSISRFVGHPTLTHPANGPLQAIYLRRAQHAYGNRFVQRVASRAQLTSEGDDVIDAVSAPQSTLPLSAPQTSRRVQSHAVDATGTAAEDRELIPRDSSGHPLDAQTRVFMESRFGADFGQVRVHADAPAAESTKALDADAYTTGQDIYFAATRYTPTSGEGRQLLAHELTHVIQQRDAGRLVPTAMHGHSGVSVGRADDLLEREADDVADAVISSDDGSKRRVSAPSATPGVQRQEASSDKPREQPTTFPPHEEPKQGKEKDEAEKEKLEKSALKAAGEFATRLWDEFSNSQMGKNILSANERDLKPIIKFFEDFSSTAFGKIVLGTAAGGAATGAFLGARAARDDGGTPDASTSGATVPTAPKDEKFFALELNWDFVSPPTGFTLKTPWLDLPKVGGSSSSTSSTPLPPAPQLIRPAARIPRICTPADPQGDQGEAAARDAQIYSWLLWKTRQDEQRMREILRRSIQTPGEAWQPGTFPKVAPAQFSPIKPMFKRADGAEPLPDTHLIDEGLESPGHPLDLVTRTSVEHQFGYDLSDVHIHTDGAAAQSADVLGAHAYTRGRHIYFGSGKYAPEHSDGRRLLAHELTHVLQHASGSTLERSVSDSAEPAEREADAVSTKLAQPQNQLGVCVNHATTSVVHRDASDAGMTSSSAPMSVAAPEPNQTASSPETSPPGAAGMTSAEAPMSVTAPEPNQSVARSSAARPAPVVWGIDTTTRGLYASVRSPGCALADVAMYLFGSPSTAARLAEANGGLPSFLQPGTTLRLDAGGSLTEAARRAADAALERGTVLRTEGVPAASGSAGVMMYRFTANGEAFELTEAQFHGMLRGLSVWLVRKASYLRDRARSGRWVQQDHVNRTNAAVRGVSNLFAGQFVPNEIIWDVPERGAQRIIDSVSDAQLSADLIARNARALQIVARGLDDSFQTWHEYIERTISGAQSAVHVLEITRDVSFGIAIGIGAVVAAPVVAGFLGTGTLATGAIVTAGGGGTGAVLRGGTSIVGQALASDPGQSIDWREVRGEAGAGLVQGSIAAGSALVFPGVAGAVSSRLYGVAPTALTTFGSRAAVNVLAGIVVGAPAGMLDAAAMNIPALVNRRISTSEYLSRIGWAGFQGALLGGAFGLIHTALTRPAPRSTALAAPEPTPLTPGTRGPSQWQAAPPEVNPATGEVTQFFRHTPSGEVLQLRFDPATGSGSLTRVATGEVLPIVGGQLQRPPAGLLTAGEPVSAEAASAGPSTPLAPQPSPLLESAIAAGEPAPPVLSAEPQQLALPEGSPRWAPATSTLRTTRRFYPRREPAISYGRSSLPPQEAEPGAGTQHLMSEASRAETSATRELEALPGSERGRAVAMSEHPSISGWTNIPERYVQVPPEEVARHADEIGHVLRPSGALDQADAPGGFRGRYHASHAEKKQIVARPNQPVGVNLPMCDDCIAFFRREAIARREAQVVADPHVTRVFDPDGTVTEYWRQGPVVRLEPDGSVRVIPAPQ